MATAEPQQRIPVICVDPSMIAGAEVFEVNAWAGATKGIIQSCWSEYSVLHHCVSQIAQMCANAYLLCKGNITTLQEQWRAAKFDLDKVIIYGQQPDLHIRIEAFFSGVKTLLDFLAQLLSTERIVDGAIHGFHRDKRGYGGRVLNALRGNARKENKGTAEKIDALIVEHKKLWIDQVVEARDMLVHPQRGMHQIMFILEMAEKDEALICAKAHPPAIGPTPIDVYANDTLKHIASFSHSLMTLLRKGHV